MKTLKHFTGNKWWEQTNPAYRQACFNKNLDEMVTLKGKYDYFIKLTTEIKLKTQ